MARDPDYYSNKYLNGDGLIYVWSKIKAQLNTKVDKVTGKGLSTNDYTTTEKNKLSGIETGANKYVLPKATTSALGGIIVGDNLTVDSSGKLSAIQGSYTLPTASASTLGGIKVGTNLSIDSSGILSATDTTYDAATTSANGLMSATDKSKLDGIEAQANKYVHPTHTNKASGLYKVTIDSLGHVSAATAVAKSDITALGIPAQDTTYSVATTSANGLMSSGDKTKLNGIESEANKYVHPSYTSKASGLYKVTVDATGHVSAATAVAKSDITALGIPAQDTTYNNATTSTAGLMSAADKTKLDGIDITGIYKYKGSVATVSALPTTGVSVGDVYNVEADGMNYAWTGTAWDALGASFSIQSITNAEIDEICV